MSKFIRLLIIAALAAVALAAPQVAHAQSTFTYVNGTNGTIDNTTTCTAPLVRNFSVSDSFTISDVDIGVFATHTWRGDMQITLQSPAGTRIQLVDGDVNNTSGDNFNVRLNDGGTQVVNTDSATAAHSTAAPPPFANNFIPNASLSGFAGETSNGTWRLEICDLFPSQDNGTFQHAELYLTSAPTNYADLSLNKSVSNTSPTNGSTITYTLQLQNSASSPQTATSVVVNDVLPPGATYSSHSGFGSYDSVSGDWSISSVAPGQTRTLTIQATVNATAGATVTNAAEVTASSVTDLDSTPNNGATGEDDYDSVSFTVAGTRVAGTPPTLVCPAGTLLFDWDTRTWTAGSLNNTYNLTGLGDINFALSSNGTWVNDAGFGGQSPTLSTANSGGLPGSQVSLHQFLDFANQSQTATTVITLPNGIAGAQFIVFDIDFAANDFADKLTVTGRYKGATVIPTLTNGVVNYVVGNTAIGDGGSGGTSGDGNVVVTFSQPIDEITIVYGNHTTAPAVPDGQAIAIHDFNFCRPATNLSVTKTSAVISDPVNNTTDPKAIPGAVMQYSILVSNTGISATDADTVVVADDVPPEAKMCLDDIAGLGTGPVRFIDGGTSSALTYNYTALGNLSDDLEFSNDGGGTWNYVPVQDSDGCDPAITDFRVAASGAFASSGSFTLQALFIIE